MSQPSSTRTAAEPAETGAPPGLGPDEGWRIAHALGQVGNNAGAIDILRRVLAAHPEHPRTLARLGFYLELTGLVRDARQAAGAAVALAPNDPECHRMLGMVLQGGGAYRDALVHFDEALRLDPGNAYAHYGRALVHTNLGRAHEALAAFEAAAMRAPGEAFILVHASDCLFQLRCFREARTFADRAFACGPEHPGAQAAAARFRLIDGRHAEALDLYEAAVANGNTEFHTLSGLIEARLCRHRVFALWSRGLAWARGGSFRAGLAVFVAVSVAVQLIIAAANLSPILVLVVLGVWAGLLASLAIFCQIHQRRLDATQRPVRLARRF